MLKLFELVGVIRVDGLEKAEKGISDLEKQVKKGLAPIERYGKKLEGIGKNLSMALTLPLALAGGAVLKFGGDFEAAMTNSLSIMGDVGAGMRSEMEAVALDLSETLPVSAAKAAEAYFFIASAGKTAAQAISLLPQVAKFATAGNFDMARATDLLMDSQSALGLSSKNVAKDQENLIRVSDVLVKANILSNGSTEQFAEALTNKAAAALRLLNKDVEEGVAVLAAYAEQGVKGEKAGEQLAIIIRDLQKAALDNATAFKNANIQVYDSAGKMNNLGDIVKMLETRLGGMSDSQKRSELTMLGFQDRSISAMLTLMGTSAAIKTYEAELRKAGGTTQSVSDKQMQGFNNQWQTIKNSIVNVAISFSTSLLPVLKQNVLPVIESVVSKVKGLVEWFNGLPVGVQNTVLGMTALVAVAGPALLIIGKLLTSVKLITTAFTLAKLAMVAFNSTLAVSPIGISIALVVGLVTAFTSLKNVSNDVSNKIDAVKESAKNQRAEFDVLSQRLLILSQRQNDNVEAHNAYLKAVDDIKAQYPGYFTNLDKEKTSHQDLITILEEEKKAFYAKIAVQMRQEEIGVFVTEQIKLQKELNKLKDTELTQAALISGKEQELEPLKAAAIESIKKEQAARQKLREEYGNGIVKMDEYQQGIEASISDLSLQESYAYDNKSAFMELDKQKEEHFKTETEIEQVQKRINELLKQENAVRNEYTTLMGGVIDKKKEDNELTAEEIAALEALRQKTLQQIEAENQLREEKESFISGYQDRINQTILTEIQLLDQEEASAMASAERMKLSEEQKAEIKAFYEIKRFEAQVKADNEELEASKAKDQALEDAALESYNKRQQQIAEEVAAEKKKWDTIKQFASSVLSGIADIYSIYTSNKSAEIDQQLEKDKAAVEASKLSEEEKQKKFEELDAKAAKKKKALQIQEAKANKVTSIINATTSTWEAATKALTAGPVLGPIMAGIITALGLAKVAMIASTPLPQLAEGALIKASDGGTNVTVGEGGQDETVLPMRKGAFEIADRIMGHLSDTLFPVGNQPSLATGFGSMGSGGTGSRTVEHHYHFDGTIIADEPGLKKLERRLRKVRVSDETRRGE